MDIFVSNILEFGP